MDDELTKWIKENDALAGDSFTDKEFLFEKTTEGYNKFNGAENPDLLWRMARAMYLMSCTVQNRSKKEMQMTYLLQAEEFGKKSIVINPDILGSHMWMAMILGRIAEFAGIKQKLNMCKKVQAHLKTAIKLKSDEPYLFHIYGRWCFEVAKLSWVERYIARIFFESPPEATYEDALNNFRKAEKLKRNFKLNLFFIFKTYIGMKRYKQAIEYLDRAMSLPSKLNEEFSVTREMVGLSKKYSKYR